MLRKNLNINLLTVREFNTCVGVSFLIKLQALGFFTVTFLTIYLKNRKNNVKINNTYSVWNSSFWHVTTKGSVLGPIIFNIFLNDLFLWLTKSDINNFADDNTINVTSRDFEKLSRTLEDESNLDVNLFRNNNVINPDQFQAIVVNKKESDAIHSV